MKLWKKLVLVYLMITIVKIIMAYFIPAPSAFSDGYVYAKMARSFFFSGNFLVHGNVPGGYPFLYPLVLSISYVFKDMNIAYFFMKVINSLVSSLIIFPSFLLAREFLGRKKSLIVAFLISIIPANFIFSNYIMSENLLYPLFMFAIYFIYKSFTNNNLYHYFIALILSFLCLLTKINSIILLLLIFIMPFISYFILKNKKVNKLMFVLPLFSFLAILLVYFLDLFSDVFEHYYAEATQVFSLSFPWIGFFAKFLLSFSSVFLGSGLIFLLMIFFIDTKIYKIKIFAWITALTSIFALFTAANHGIYVESVFFSWLPNRPIGRYLDIILPLILMIGFIGFRHFEIYYNKNKDKLLNLFLLFTPITLYSALLTIYSLFPSNNMSLTWLGVLKYASDYLFFGVKGFEIVHSYYSLFAFALLLTSILWFFYFLYKTNLLRLNKIYTFFIIFFFLVSILAYSATYYNSSKYWYKGEQMQLGLWFNEYDKEKMSNFLFDERDCTGSISKANQDALCEPSGAFTIMGFWINDNIKIGTVDNLEDIDYVVSKSKLNLELIKETKNGIFLYKVNRG